MPDNGEQNTSTDPQATPEVTEQQETSATGEDALGDAGKQALDRMKAERNEAAREAKALRAELEAAKKATMSETEKAIAEAEAKGRTAAASEFGKELAREKFDALAGRRNADFDTAKALEYVDLSKFLGEDGRPDPKAIAAAVERLVPEAGGTTAGFDGGSRTSAPNGSDFNAVLRKAAGRA